MQRARTELTFTNLEPVYSVIAEFLGNDAIVLRGVCKLTRYLRASLVCDKAMRIPPLLEKLIAYEVAPGTLLPSLRWIRTLRIHGRVRIKTSTFHTAIQDAPLEEFTCSILFQQDMLMDEFTTFLLTKKLTVLQLDECVTDTVLPLIGEHPTLKKLAISLNGDPDHVQEIAKCSTLREVRLEVPETYPPNAFQAFSALPLTSFELNGCNSFACVQASLTQLTTISFREYEVDLNLLKGSKIKILQIWCENAVGELDETLPLEWLVMKARDSWMPLPTLPKLQVLSVNTLFTEDLELILAHSPLLRVFEFGLYYETMEEHVRILAALSNLKLEFIGVFCERQIKMQTIMNVCHHLKVLVLEGEEPVSPQLRASAAKHNIFFENSDLVINYAFPNVNLF